MIAPLQPISVMGTLKMLSALLVVALVAACDGTSEAQLIATYPRQEPPAGQTVVRSAQLELAVDDAGEAARRLADLAAAHGGYVVDSNTWYWQGKRQATVTVSLPAGEFASFRRALLRLGTLLSERVTEVVDGHPGAYAQVVVTLRSERRPALRVPSRGWSPLDTFRAAFAVFMGIFQVLVDGLIWLLVVAGPLALMFVGLLALIRRLRGRMGQSPPEEAEGEQEAASG